MQLFQKLKTLVFEDRYVIGQHASERLEERGIMEWQVVVGLANGVLLKERLDAQPNPIIAVHYFDEE